MTGWNFSGEEMCWRHARHEYGAIHFHDDDLYDADWDVDFEWTVPARVASGVYAARLRAKGAEEYVPFVVLPSPGKAARIAFLLPTVEYMAYANEHLAFDGPLGELLTGQIPTLNANQLFLNEHREYGASLYDTHSDGSGVCYSSRLRPILNMRPKVETPWSCAGEDATNRARVHPRTCTWSTGSPTSGSTTTSSPMRMSTARASTCSSPIMC